MATPETDWIGIALAAIGGVLAAIVTMFKAAWNLSKQLSGIEGRLKAIELHLGIREDSWHPNGGRREAWRRPDPRRDEDSDQA